MKNHVLKRLSRKLRGHWRARSLAPYGIAIVTQTKNGLLAVQPGDFNVSRELMKRGEYDWQAINWLTRLLDADSRLVFAGAHIGSLLVPICMSCGARSVLAIEPSPRNFRLLTMNLRMNKLDYVETRNVALGRRQGKLRFTENCINSGNSRIAELDGEIVVNVDTLDHCLPPDWRTIDLMVMDIEGSEAAAMQGAPKALDKTRYLYVEYAPEQLCEQGSSAAEFLELVSRHFRSAYLFGPQIEFLGPDEFAGYLRSLQERKGLLRNVLFTRDHRADPSRMSVDV